MKSRLTSWLAALLIVTAVFGLPVTRVATNSVCLLPGLLRAAGEDCAEQVGSAGASPNPPRRQLRRRSPATFPERLLDHSLFQRPPPASLFARLQHTQSRRRGGRYASMAALHARPRPVERAADQRDAGRIRASGRRRIARHRIENNGTARVDRADRDGRGARAGARHVRRATARGARARARQHRRDADRRREDAGRRAGDLVVRARAAAAST